MMIAAISTPHGRGAISIVRMSGDGVIDVAKTMFCPFPTEPGQLKLGKLNADGFLDQAMCVFFTAPKSYTGEDMVEFQLHGGSALADGVLKSCLNRGCRLAEGGEFTRRAYLNGKMNLSAVEGVMDVIDAESAAAVRNGFKMLTGKLDEKITKLQDGLTDLLAEIEVALDYPEEDLEFITRKKADEALAQAKEQTNALLAGAKTGKLVKNGVDVAIVGKTNVGKSSLLNAFLGYDRAIVTDVEGTTRDTLCESYVYKDVKFNFIDTAGLRKTGDLVENMGIERAVAAANNADVVLLVFDGGVVPEEYAATEQMPNVIKVFNKCDVNSPAPADIAVSAKTGEGINELKEMIYRKVKADNISSADLFVTNSRHVDCLRRAAQGIDAALAVQGTLDLVALEIKTAWSALGEITGATATEDVINRIFEKFCVGK